MSAKTAVPTDAAIIGAIRLAIVGAANDRTALAVIEALLRRAEDTPENDYDSPKLFVETVRDLSGTWEVDA